MEQGLARTDGLFETFTKNVDVSPSGGTEVRLELPAETTYYWCAVYDGCTFERRGATTLVRGQQWWSWQCAADSPGVVVKLTAFSTVDDGVNKPLGTALFRVQSTLTKNSRYSGVYLRIPKVEGGSNQIKTKLNLRLIPRGVEVKEDKQFKEAVDDMFKKLPGSARDLNQYAMISWQLPFRVPGWLGFRELADPVPGWKASLGMLEWHGLSAFGFDSWGRVTSNGAKLDVFSAAVAVAAYSSGYERECVDDRSKPWSSFGTGKDCDDFASQVCSLVTWVIREGGKPGTTTGIWQFANEYFDAETLMVAGTAKPHFATPDTIGHMWCEVRLKKELVLRDIVMYDVNGNKVRVGTHILRKGDRIPIECTCGVTFFGTELYGKGNGFDLRYGSISSYYGRESLQSASAAYILNRDVKDRAPGGEIVWPPAITKHDSHGIEYPWWWDKLRYPSPLPDIDGGYSVLAVQQIPEGHAVYGVYSVRLLERYLGEDHKVFDRDKSSDNGVYFVRLLPFSNDTIWFIGTKGSDMNIAVLDEIRGAADPKLGSY
jgi:hypothetical protein